MVKIIDTHAHFNDKYFLSLRDEKILKLNSDNMQYVFVVGYDKNSSLDAINLANKYDNIYAIIGLHPTDANCFNDEFENMLIENAKNPKVIAIGEIGLDYYWNKDNKIKQAEIFIKQMEIANKVGLPIVIHCRDAIGDLIKILNENKRLLNNGGVIHCFNESVESYKILKGLGFKFSFGGAITFKNSINAKNLINEVDLNDILLETDSPYLTPEPLRGKEKNEPKNVWLVLNKIAELKNMDVMELAKITNNNVYSVFKKVKRVSNY